MNHQELIEQLRKAVISPFDLGPVADAIESLLAENERLNAECDEWEANSKQWEQEYYKKDTELAKQRDELLAALGSGGRHCNDDTPHSDLCEAIIDSKEADLGQGLDPFWKWAFRRGFHEAETSYKVDIATLEQQRDELLAELERFMDSHEECTDFDGFTAQIVSMADYHQAQEAIARVKGEQ